MTTKTTLTALALAAAAFTTLSVGSASANFLQNLPGHGPVVGTIGTVGASGSLAGRINGGIVDRLPPNRQVLPWRPGPGHFPPPHESEPGKGSGGEVISCHLGAPCTITGGDRDRDHDHDHDWDRDHYRGHYRDFYHWYRDWSYYSYPRWHWTLPPVYTSYYPTPVECSYEYKWSSVYQPGFGLRRVVVKACGDR